MCVCMYVCTFTSHKLDFSESCVIGLIFFLILVWKKINVRTSPYLSLCNVLKASL